MKKVKISYIFLFLPLLILNGISLLNMVNAKLISNTYKNAFFKQFLWIALGYIIIWGVKKFKITKKLLNFSYYIYIFTIFLLILVLLAGTNINGAKCWLSIGLFSFQPSELVKISLSLILVNKSINSKITNIKDELLLISKLILLTLIPSILVFLEPDTGAIINYFIILLIVIFNAKLHKEWYFSFIGITLFCITLFLGMYFFYQDKLIQLIGTSIFYRMDRIINFTNGSSYQLENALVTIGSATFFGVGLNNIVLYIPEAPTDFIFAFSIGNFGIFSGILILLSYFVLNMFLLYKTYKEKEKNKKMFIYIFTFLLFFHEFYNIFMNIGLLPIMGIPLPFLSYGGTNMLINYLFLGIVLTI